MQANVLYSFRRCPYAMRARLAIRISEVQLQLREVVLKDKPEQLLKASPKATVPVLILACGTVIDESLGIMQWALSLNDPEGWLEKLPAQLPLVEQCDNVFKPWLDKYKYADRYPEFDEDYYRRQGCEFLAQLEARLTGNRYLMGEELTLADAAIFPFIRQFAHVDKKWFEQTPFNALRIWLNELLASALFQGVMEKYPPWQEGQRSIYF